MKNEFRWIQIGEISYELQDENNTLGTLSYNEVHNLWYLQFEYCCNDTIFLPDEIDNLKCLAINYIIDHCEEKIKEYQDIQNRVAM